MSELRDPREVAKCTCPRLDGRDCYRVRSGKHLIDDLEYWASYDDHFDCACACHGIYEDQLWDEECDEEAAIDHEPEVNS